MGSARASAGSRLMLLCSVRCVTPVLKPSATINWGWWEQVRQNLEKATERVYGQGKVLRFHDVLPEPEKGEELVVCK